MESIVRPTIIELERRISEIEMLDLSLLSIDDIKSRFKLLFTGYRVSTFSLNPGFLVYRGIRYGAKPNFFSNISYPPSDKAKMGRANREGTPIFYCATDKAVTFFELNAMVGERLVISEWTIQKELLLNNIGYTDSVFKELNSVREVPIFEPTENLNEQVLFQGNALVQNFLAKTFSQKISGSDSHLYKITNAIAEKHFSEDSAFEYANIKGLMYPTIRMQANADNLAINQLTIDKEYLQFDRAEYVEVINVSGNIYTYKILDVAFKICGEEIQWKNLNCHWIIDSESQLYLVDEDTAVLAYDSRGDLIRSNKNNG